MPTVLRRELMSLCALLACAGAQRAAAADHLVGHATSASKYAGAPAVGTQYKFIAKAGADGNPAQFALPTDPVFGGGSVIVARDAGTLSDPLTAGFWKGLGSPTGSGGWKYTNRNAPNGGAVKVLLIKPSLIKVLAKGLGTMPAPAASNGAIDTVVVADDQRYCARAEAPHFMEIADQRIKTKNQSPPAACPSCVLGVDSDGDRLDNCYESNSGVFINTTNTGTDPNDADSDGDALPDGDEVLGTLGGLNLPGMGTNPLRRNILIEYDWFTDSLECGFHSHQPNNATVARVTAAFAAAPLVNPDGSTGISLIHDRGQGGLFTGGNLIADADGVLSGDVDSAEYNAMKLANFAANRNGYFHYTVLPHRYNTNSASSGQAELPGDDMIVSLYCFNSDVNVANTIMHELGHNLFLGHGGFGFQGCNYKPNYNSVMNYLYQFPGVDSDCDPLANGVLDYSHGTRIALDEANLNENAGTCGFPGWDWNGNSTLESGVVFDVNAADVDEVANCGGAFTVLQDSDDWSNLSLTGLSDSDGARLTPTQVIDCDNVPPPDGP